MEINKKTDRPKVEIIIEEGVSNSYNIRHQLNVIYVTDQRDYLPEIGTIMYYGVSSTAHIELFDKLLQKSDILVSYYYCKDAVYKALKGYKK
jgi:hypothetical protein